VLGEAVIYEGLVLIRPADEGPVVSRVGKDVEGLAVFSNLGQLPGRKGVQLLLLGGRLGRDGLKAGRDQHILLALGGGARSTALRSRAARPFNGPPRRLPFARELSSTARNHFPFELGVRAGGTACSYYYGFLNGKDET
jgi:hypothetical protein